MKTVNTTATATNTLITKKGDNLMQEMQEEASCQTGAIEPQDENEGIWATVKEYKRIKQTVSQSMIYRYVRKGYFKSKIINANSKHRGILMFIKKAQDVANILRLRELKKDAPKPKPRILCNPDHIYHMKLVFPSFEPEQIGSFLDIIRNPSLIAEKCDRIGFSLPQEIKLNVDTYNIIKGKAKEHGMKVEDMMKDMIYRILLEQSQKSKEAAK